MAKAGTLRLGSASQPLQGGEPLVGTWALNAQMGQKACVHKMCTQVFNNSNNHNNNIFYFGVFLNLCQWPFLDIQGGVVSGICILPD